uniref:Prephenate dehydrogenase n=1 Tax=Dictyoglomus thermophilum TaxID=14 RepID=A0A7C3MJ02_DICTH
MKIGIIGLGLIGTSIAMAIKKENRDIEIWGIDTNRDTLNFLKDKDIFSHISIDISEIEKEIYNTDIIFISVYPSGVRDVLLELKNYIPERSIISDTSSTKGKIMTFVNNDKLLCKVFIGGHPLAGREISGAYGAISDLFKGKIYFLSPAKGVEKDKIETLMNFIENIGALPVLIDPYEHDRILAYSSHLPQIVAYLLAYTSIRNSTNFFGTGFKDTTRIAKSDTKLWMDIIKENYDEILNVFCEFKNNIDFFINYLRDKNFEKIEEIFRRAREKRMKIEG